MTQTHARYMKIVLISAVLVITGCQYVPHYSPGRGHGPPPHAPAHGYRDKHHGHDLVYDSGLGVYVVVGLPNVYFHDGFYYRYDGGRWYVSNEPDRGWKDSDDRRLPPGLAKKQGKGKGKGRGRGNPHD